jgi:ElaB/YqjD/DUF883 family membrane-anchored ribosome-binding protein
MKWNLADGANVSEPVVGASDEGQERSTMPQSLLFATGDLLYPVAVRAGQNYMLHLIKPFPNDDGGDSPLPRRRPGVRSGRMERYAIEALQPFQSKPSFLDVGTMKGNIQQTRAEFTPQLKDIRAMSHQDIAVARERISDGKAILRDCLVREPVKALGITVCIGVALGWLIRRR